VADLSGAFLAFIEKYSWRGMFGLFVASGLLLFFCDRMGWMVCVSVDASRAWFLGAFIFSAVVSFTYCWTALAPWVSRHWSVWQVKRSGRKHLRNLSADEKVHCRWFVNNNGASLHHNETNGALGSLLQAGIVFTPGQPWGNGMRDFRMRPWHLEFLKKHPSFLA
jgi:Super-infection exclusion protein B